jgi:L-amino acid N-acyltransferase YncA
MAVAGIYAPFVTDTAISFELSAPSPEDMAARIERLGTSLPWLVAEQAPGTGVLGYAYAQPFAARVAYRWSVETSIYVDRDAARHGVGRALYRSLLGMLRAQGYRAAFAGIALPHPGSVGFHEAFGFRPVGVFEAVGWKLGRWHDVGWWQLDLCAPGDELAEPRAIAQLTGDELDAVLGRG